MYGYPQKQEKKNYNWVWWVIGIIVVLWYLGREGKKEELERVARYTSEANTKEVKLTEKWVEERETSTAYVYYNQTLVAGTKTEEWVERQATEMSWVATASRYISPEEAATLTQELIDRCRDYIGSVENSDPGCNLLQLTYDAMDVLDATLDADPCFQTLSVGGMEAFDECEGGSGNFVFPMGTPSICPTGCTYHPAGCDIKGNISFTTKEKIYHVPGQEYYDEAVIDSDYGERWFCTEAEAIANGWRKALN